MTQSDESRRRLSAPDTGPRVQRRAPAAGDDEDGGFSRPVVGLVVAGALLRVVFWRLNLPIWKHFAAFTFFEQPPLVYLGNFQSYSAVRMPFYDLFALAGHFVADPIIGVRALTLFSLLVSIVSIPAFYLGVRRLLNAQVALFALVPYALYPKFLVLVGLGFPEASSVAFVALALYTLTRAEAATGSARSSWFVVTGAFATLSYLIFVPAVYLAVLLAGYCYLRDVRARPASDRTKLGSPWPGVPTIAYSTVPFVVGVCYLVFGPVATAATTVSGEWTNIATSLFRPGASYGFAEKVARYVVSMYFDVWSFGRGYDKGHHVVRKLSSLESFTGGAFPVLMTGYVVVTLALTAVFVYGCVRLARRRDDVDLFLLATLVGYAILHTAKNWGWNGVFQSRHVFPYFPVTAVAFGVGAAALFRPGMPVGARLVSIARRVHLDGRRTALALGVLCLCFTPLLAVSIVDSGFSGNHHYLEDERPNHVLDGLVDQDERVAVASVSEYQTMVMYTGNRVRPTILIQDESRRDYVDTWTVVAESEVVPPAALSNGTADYFFLSECGPLTDAQRAYLTAARETGDVVHEETTRRGAGRCTVRAYVVRL